MEVSDIELDEPSPAPKPGLTVELRRVVADIGAVGLPNAAAGR